MPNIMCVQNAILSHLVHKHNIKHGLLRIITICIRSSSDETKLFRLVNHILAIYVFLCFMFITFQHVVNVQICAHWMPFLYQVHGLLSETSLLDNWGTFTFNLFILLSVKFLFC